MMRIRNPMSGPREDGCYCKKCGAPVDPTEEKCPKGHVLAEVGRAYVRSASESLKITAEAVSIVQRASETVIMKLNEYKEIHATLNVKQKDDYLNEINKNLEIIVNQTRKKSLPEKIKDKIMDNILSYIILLIIGYLAAILS